ncbi:predicted protein [Aspergillus terreus NIH2624]|uniref:Uncharacterized protein n=1 Tax=Aspergillus terreus (strain NIH 2624 / FGSC A1156) TaxID=341663 RepID=Q0CHB5_ASPTN|nr:uncharacterized protein ATEG_06927 [Aspergillus terreus NIH2624]EAU32311.1 predicted protein [Aspergillus terreus NIH2624]
MSADLLSNLKFDLSSLRDILRDLLDLSKITQDSLQFTVPYLGTSEGPGYPATLSKRSRMDGVTLGGKKEVRSKKKSKIASPGPYRIASQAIKVNDRSPDGHMDDGHLVEFGMWPYTLR